MSPHSLCQTGKQEQTFLITRQTGSARRGPYPPQEGPDVGWTDEGEVVSGGNISGWKVLGTGTHGAPRGVRSQDSRDCSRPERDVRTLPLLGEEEGVLW